jgi:uncharacterized membrane protein YfcA
LRCSAALLMLPPLLMGTTLGTLADKVLPQWLIVAALFAVLSAMAVRTGRKGLLAWRAEGRTQRSVLPSAFAPGEGEDGPRGRRVDERSEPLLAGEAPAEAARARSRSPPPLFPRHKLWYAAVSWCVVAAVALARGGHGAPSMLPGVACGNGPYWLLLLAAWAALAALTAAVRALLLAETEALEAEPRAATLTWTRASTLAVPALCFGAGVAAGMLGIGGGMLIGPLLLELGVEPLAVAATGAFVVLVADTSVAAQYAVLGLLPGALGLQLAATAFAATSAGQAAAERFIRATGRPALVTLIIAAVIALSTLATGAVAARDLADAVREGKPMGFRSLCGKD